MSTYSYTISNVQLSLEEKSAFSSHLNTLGVDEAIWHVYDCFLASESHCSKPRLIRAMVDDNLAGVAYFIICSATGATLFKNAVMAKLVDALRIPSYLWLRQGICADLMANPGFVANGYDHDEVICGIMEYLKKKASSLFITDLASEERFHKNAKIFPYTKEGGVSVVGMSSSADYVAQHANIKRKIKAFVNKGGTVDMVCGPPDSETCDRLLHCVRATMDASFIHTPFQELFPTLIEESCRIQSDRIVYAVPRMKGEIIGYHAFVRTGRGLRLLHGAFDRTRKTTHHAYENIMIEAAGFAIQEGLDEVHFGPIMNETKRRMMNVAHKTNIYFQSNNPINRLLLPFLYRRSSMQNEKLLAFS